MKLSLSTTTMAMMLSGAATFSVSSALDFESSVPATVAVKCSNVDWTKLNPLEGKFAAGAVEKAFLSTIVGSELQDTQYKPHDRTTMMASTAHAYGHFSTKIYHAIDPKEDSSLLLQKGHVADFNKLLVRGHATGGDEGMVYNVWQNQLEYFFQSGPFLSLSQASDCHVALTMAGEAAVVPQEEKVFDDGSITNINVQCDNLDFSKLTATEKSFFANNLGRAFNKYSKMMLTAVQWDSAKYMGMGTGRSLKGGPDSQDCSVCSTCCDPGCSLCNDDDARRLEEINSAPSTDYFGFLNFMSTNNEVHTGHFIGVVHWDVNIDVRKLKEQNRLAQDCSVCSTCCDPGCSLCLDDDARRLDETPHEGLAFVQEFKKHHPENIGNEAAFFLAWGAELEQLLHNGPYSALTEAGNCAVEMIEDVE